MQNAIGINHAPAYAPRTTAKVHQTALNMRDVKKDTVDSVHFSGRFSGSVSPHLARPSAYSGIGTLRQVLMTSLLAGFLGGAMACSKKTDKTPTPEAPVTDPVASQQPRSASRAKQMSKQEAEAQREATYPFLNRTVFDPRFLQYAQKHLKADCGFDDTGQLLAVDEDSPGVNASGTSLFPFSRLYAQWIEENGFKSAYETEKERTFVNDFYQLAEMCHQTPEGAWLKDSGVSRPLRQDIIVTPADLGEALKAFEL